MQSSDIRAMSAEDLRKNEAELRERVARLTMKRNARRLDKPSDLVSARRDLARVLTVRNERARAEGAKG